MPTIAKAGKLTGMPGNTVCIADANAAPSAAPMNSDGEKIPPDDPDPRLTDVANSLLTNRIRRNPAPGIWPVQHGLDRRVSNALDVVVPL